MLTTWVLDLRSARQLGLRSTGNASRGTSGPPSPSTRNLHLEPGPLTPAELMADIASGFYCTELIGMGVNNVTGDYSRGAAGFWIENGEIAYPVAEITIAGNLKEMFLNLAPGQRPRLPLRHQRADDAGRRHDGGGAVRQRVDAVRSPRPASPPPPASRQARARAGGSAGWPKSI